MGVGVASSG